MSAPGRGRSKVGRVRQAVLRFPRHQDHAGRKPSHSTIIRDQIATAVAADLGGRRASARLRVPTTAVGLVLLCVRLHGRGATTSESDGRLESADPARHEAGAGRTPIWPARPDAAGAAEDGPGWQPRRPVPARPDPEPAAAAGPAFRRGESTRPAGRGGRSEPAPGAGRPAVKPRTGWQAAAMESANSLSLERLDR